MRLDDGEHAVVPVALFGEGFVDPLADIVGSPEVAPVRYVGEREVFVRFFTESSGHV